jgi:Domain of unknown function (DUF4388)
VVVHRHREVTVALQGTLDTFALPDVLRLLASTKKTGRLRVSGSRGTGSVWIDAGQVVSTEATGVAKVDRPVDVVFELLRYRDGSFTFESDKAAPYPDVPSDVEPLLIEAEQLLGEWRDIEAVVPSLEHWVSLVAELPRPDVVVDAERWRAIVAVAGGVPVRTVGESLSMGEVAVSRQVKDLVELGLASVGAPAPAPARTPDPFPTAQAEPAPPPYHADPPPPPYQAEAPTAPVAVLAAVPDPGPEPARRPFEPLLHEPLAVEHQPQDAPGAEAEPFHGTNPYADMDALRSFGGPGSSPPPPPGPLDADPYRPAFGGPGPGPDAEPLRPAFGGQPQAAADDAGRPSFGPPGPTRRSLGRPAGDGSGEEADEVARQLATLSPKAARAVAAAARAETDEEREAALAEVSAETEEPINRGLLLKFLSSVRS